MFVNIELVKFNTELAKKWLNHCTKGVEHWET